MCNVNILMIGAGGMLGYTTLQYLREKKYSVTGITKAKERKGLVCLDVTDEPSVTRFLTEYSFDVIINCAALLVKASEECKSGAVALNTWFPHYLAEHCSRNGVYLVQVSTDGVFSGASGDYLEDSPSDADSFYGKSKFLGEVSEHALTVRSGFWGPDINRNGCGLFHWFMQQRGQVSGYTKAFFNGVSNLEFAKFVEQAIQARWTGIFHLCAADPVSKYGFLQLQNEVFCRHMTIDRNESVQINRTLRNTRADVPYVEKTFSQMMLELKAWLQDRDGFADYAEEG